MARILAILSVLTFAAPGLAAEEEPSMVAEDYGFLAWPVDRSGFHFQLVIGAGAGSHASGGYHSLEIGYTFDNGWTLAFWHPVIENDSNEATSEPLRYIGLLIEWKMPLFVPALVVKLGVGGAGTHENDPYRPVQTGVGWAYGLDFHLPFFENHGATLSLTGMHVILEDRAFSGVALGAGYTFF